MKTICQKKLLILLLACLLIGTAVFAADQVTEETFVEDETLEFDDSEGMEPTFDEDDTGEFSMADEVENGDTDEEASFLEGLTDPARFTRRHELSYKTEEPAGIKNNRSSFRLEYSRFFLDHFFIQFDVKINTFWGNDHRAEAEDEELLYETSNREAFLQFSFGETSIKIGNQVMIWGESDGGAITDVISPRDYSELFFISLEESRVGQAMVALDQFSTIGQWSLFVIPDPGFNEYPEEDTAYYVDPFDGQAVIRDEEDDDDLTEYGMRWKKTFGKSDISLMAASLIANDYAYRLAGFTSTGKMLFSRIRQRFSMIGTAFNYVTGSFLFKGEIGRKTPRLFNVTGYQVVEKDVLDTALGLEYAPGGTWSLGFELVNSHVDDWTGDILGVPEDSSSLVVVWDKTFLNEDLSVSWMTQVTDPYRAYVHSLTTSYEWNDSITLYLDAFFPDVQEAENDLWVYRDQKQVVTKIQYQF